MNDRDRLEQLRGLLDRLERLPASADRDWMLREVRARAVDVETGVKPAALRALPQEEANGAIAAAQASPAEPPGARGGGESAGAKPARREPEGAAAGASRAGRVVGISRPSLPAVRERVGDESAVDLLGQSGLLCLGEPPADAAAASRPWSGGLRG